MASADGGAALPATSRSDSNEISNSDSNSTHGSFSTSPCPHRTSRFSDGECARYLDCPTHLQERPNVENGEEAGPSCAPSSLEASHQSNTFDQDQPPPPNGALSPDDLSTPQEDGRRDNTDSSVHDTQVQVEALTLDHESRNGASSPHDTDEASRSGDNEDADTAEDASESASEDAAEAPITLREALEETRESQNGSSPNEAAPPQINHITASPISRGSLPNPPMAPDYNPRTERRSPHEFTLPRWQPDAEVTCCPICRTQFGFFIRKHHCR